MKKALIALSVLYMASQVFAGSWVTGSTSKNTTEKQKKNTEECLKQAKNRKSYIPEGKEEEVMLKVVEELGNAIASPAGTVVAKSTEALIYLGEKQVESGFGVFLGSTTKNVEENKEEE